MCVCTYSGPGSASTFEELLEKKLQLYEVTMIFMSVLISTVCNTIYMYMTSVRVWLKTNTEAYTPVVYSTDTVITMSSTTFI